MTPLRKRAAGGCSPGFTLIELLTVIAIIGVLAAILIPVVGRVRTSASQATAISNFRQVASGVLLFAADNKDRLPGIYQPSQNASQYMLVGGQTAYARDDVQGYKYLVHPVQIGRYLNAKRQQIGSEVRWYSELLESPAVRSQYPNQVVKIAQLSRQVYDDAGNLLYPFGWQSPRQESLTLGRLATAFTLSRRWMLHDETPDGTQWTNNAVHGTTLVVVHFDGSVRAIQNNRSAFDANNDGLLPES